MTEESESDPIKAIKSFADYMDDERREAHALRVRDVDSAIDHRKSIDAFNVGYLTTLREGEARRAAFDVEAAKRDGERLTLIRREIEAFERIATALETIARART